AVFWHSFRGECEGIRTSDVYEEEPPFGMCSEFLTGGGPRPRGLSEKAEAYLGCLLERNGKALPNGG
ncbi:hypothetical protein JW921_10200, partial [Candidatus Fermentibacterales bacterium]|nr:hypothetical protein [Candidatus Fermentibacterales bacterium]